MRSFRIRWCPHDHDAYAESQLGPHGVLETFIRGAVNRCNATLVEPSGKGIRPQLVKPNAHELAEVTGRPISTIDDVTAAAEVLRAKGSSTVLVSLVVTARSLSTATAHYMDGTAAVDAINTVCAGDAFLAGYLAADANALRPEDRLTWALRWGATAVQHQGTLFSRVDDRIPVRVAAADPSVTLSEPAKP
jgi:1-phosphofructokinase